MRGFMCGPKLYEYKGVKFEFTQSHGPHPIDSQGDPLEDITDDFYKLAEEWFASDNREEYRIGGGCEIVGLKAHGGNNG
jgi:hypothetical protein